MTCWCGGEIYRDECVASPDHAPYATGRKTEIKRLYLSGPMSGYAECNYPAFDGAAVLLREAGFAVVNPTEQSNEGHYTDILREDIRALLDCDGVALLPVWWESNGARTEVHIAGLLKMPVRELESWLEEARLNKQIDKLHGPGAAAAIEAAYADGSIFADHRTEEQA